MTACEAKGENEKRKSIDEKEWIRNQVILVNVFTVLTLESLAFVLFYSFDSCLFLDFLTGWGKVKKSAFLFFSLESEAQDDFPDFLSLRDSSFDQREDCILQVCSSGEECIALKIDRRQLTTKQEKGRQSKLWSHRGNSHEGLTRWRGELLSCLSRTILSTLVTLEVAAADITSSFQSSSLLPASSSIFISGVFCEFLQFLSLCVSLAKRGSSFFSNKTSVYVFTSRVSCKKK